MPGEDQRPQANRFKTLRSAASRLFARGGRGPTENGPSAVPQTPSVAQQNPSIPRDDYRSVPLPGLDANDEAFDAYRAKVARRGVTITQKDIETYRDLIGDRTGQNVLIGMQSDDRTVDGPAEGLRSLGAAYAAQHPDAVHRANEARAFAAFNIADNQAEAFPSRLTHMDPDVVTADPEEFARRRQLVNDLPAMPTRPTSSEFGATRAAFEGIGLRLTEYDRYAYQMVSEQKWRPNKATLPAQALRELEVPQGERVLLNMEPAEFAEQLRTRAPLPKERSDDLEDDASQTFAPSNDEEPYQRTPVEPEYELTPVMPQSEPIYLQTPAAPGVGLRDPGPLPKTELVGPDLLAADGGKMEETVAEAQRMEIRRGDQTFAVDPGYRQRGEVLGVSGGEIFQRIAGNRDDEIAPGDVVSYKLSDVDAQMNRREFDLAVKEGHEVVFSANQQGRMQMTDLELSKDLGPPGLARGPQRATAGMEL